MAYLSAYIEQTLKRIVASKEEIKQVSFDIGVIVEATGLDRHHVYVAEDSTNRIRFTVNISEKEEPKQ